MSEKRTTYSTGDAIACPHCTHEMVDLWDYDWSRSDELITECEECNKPLNIYRHVSVRYTCTAEVSR